MSVYEWPGVLRRRSARFESALRRPRLEHASPAAANEDRKTEGKQQKSRNENYLTTLSRLTSNAGALICRRRRSFACDSSFPFAAAALAARSCSAAGRRRMHVSHFGRCSRPSCRPATLLPFSLRARYDDECAACRPAARVWM